MTADIVYANATDFQVLRLHDRPQDADVNAEFARLYKQHGIVVRGELWERAAEGVIRGENYPTRLAEQKADNYAEYGDPRPDAYRLQNTARGGRGHAVAEDHGGEPCSSASGVIRAGVMVK